MSGALGDTDDGDTLVVADVGGTRAERASAVLDKVRSSGEKLSGQAAEKARGLVGQGLERSAEALANVGKLVGDTADGLDERLGQEYGDYARRAAGAIEDAANSLAEQGRRRVDRRHPQLRPQEPGRRAGRRGDRRIRAGPADQVRACRPMTTTTRRGSARADAQARGSDPKRPEPGDDRPVGELVHQLVEDGKAYAKAEFDLAKAMAADKGKALGIPAAMLGGAFLFLQAAVTILGVAVFLGLAPLIGPVLAGLVAFLIFAGDRRRARQVRDREG